MPTTTTISSVLPDPQAEDLDAAGPVHVEGADLGPPEPLDDCSQEEGEPDRHQQELEQAGVLRSHRRPEHPVEDDPSSAVISIAQKIATTRGAPQVTLTR